MKQFVTGDVMQTAVTNMGKQTPEPSHWPSVNPFSELVLANTPHADSAPSNAGAWSRYLFR